MIVHMKNLERLTTAESKNFLASQETVQYAAAEKQGAYAVIEAMLKAQHFRRLKKGHKGIVRPRPRPRREHGGVHHFGPPAKARSRQEA